MKERKKREGIKPKRQDTVIEFICLHYLHTNLRYLDMERLLIPRNDLTNEKLQELSYVQMTVVKI
jgi:hypothetical protein